MISSGHFRISTLSARFVVAAFTLIFGIAHQATAKIKLENICTVHGQEEIELIGIGLVVGLDGTGDGGAAAPTVRALAAAMKVLNAPVLDPRELKDAKNVAIVNIEATIPRGGLQKGQKLDCYVSSSLGAKSLRGGRLLLSALQTADVTDDRLIAVASGEVLIEDLTVKTTGRIVKGVKLKVDMVSEDGFKNRIISMKNGQPKFSLLLDEAHASFLTSNDIAGTLNDELGILYEGKGDIAKSISPSVIDVTIPVQYQNDPLEFVSDVLRVSVYSPHSQAKVIVNSRTQTVIVTGEVEISPTLVSHPGLELSIGATAVEPPSRFTNLREDGAAQSTARLADLIRAMKQLQVPPDGIIEVLRELSKSGKLHAVYEER